ncbi:DUF4394 domain-containing protein [Tellurirhabdus bombi]|uniref:DUF4394 domain-containing protein n=1 Tax=Tellurirhabdus bombi TaxID=2907205 RepID=UPI001F346109|nr:DUF4394 domain-containing protein [Tellurirhabdus bombi]
MFNFNKRTQRLGVLAAALGLLTTLNSCQDHRQAPAPEALPDVTVYGISGETPNQLVRFNVRSSGTVDASLIVRDMEPGERLLGIDFRPATGQLYGVSSASRIYVIDLKTGISRRVGTNPFTPAINGTIVGFDFNPAVDRIRIVTNTGQNLRLNPETGAVQMVDGSINGAAGVALSGAAYTNNRAGTTTTTLYDIDPATDKLYRQDPPNDGKLVEVGPLGLDITGSAGFDIAPDGRALVSVVFGGKSELQTIDLNTGRLQKLGDLPMNLIGLAIPTEPVAYAVDGGNSLHIFNPMNPAPVAKTLTGLQTGEIIVGLDFRPANGQLYALGSTSRLYTINTSSGAATQVGSGPFTPALSGGDYGFDFNPTVDRIRLVSSMGQNLRLNPETGAVGNIDGTLKPGTPTVSGAAYTNNFAAATTTTLYDIDSNTDQLLIQAPPNDGVLTVVGSLGIDVSGANGFDIGGTSGTAYAILSANGSTGIYRINLSTGAATLMSPFPLAVRGFAVGLGF